MRRHQKSTIKEVAERACVSVASVSYFASGREDKCSSETAERIREAIAHLRYTPNSLSRSLRTRSTRTIGISVGRSNEMNAYEAGLWGGMDAESDAVSYSQIYYPSEVRYGPFVDAYLDGRIDGLILSASNPDDRPKQIAAANMPIVVLSQFDDLPHGCGAVYANETQTVDLAMSHLWDLGHRRIAHVLGPVVPLSANPYYGQPSVVAIMRRDGYIQWMQERGVYEPQYLVSPNIWKTDEHTIAIIHASFEHWRKMPNPPTAAFCANDSLAIALMQVVQSYGLSVPDDFSIVGVDNDIESILSEPKLTTVAIPSHEIGRQAVASLFRIMRDAPIEECRIMIPVTELIVRGSTRAI